MKNLLIFFGGQSVEHDVSLITGVTTLNAVDKEKYKPYPILVDQNGNWYTGEILFDLDNYKGLDCKKLKRVALFGGDNRLYEIRGKKIKEICAVSVAINCMHGQRGEDGALSGLLSMCKIPLASPNELSSAVSIDKRFTKIAMNGIGVKTLPYVFVKSVHDIQKVMDKLKFPVLVKPTFLGSSIGVKSANNQKELFSALLYSMKFGNSAIVEPLLEDFIEINCACFIDEKGKCVVSPCERPVGASSVLTFEDKYKKGEREFPANIPLAQSQKIQSITKKVYEELGFSGIIRIDYFLKGKEIYLNEINSVPGSLAYYLFSNTMKEFSLVLEKNIRRAEIDYAREQTFQTTYKSGIINGFGAKGAKKPNN